MWVAIKKSPPPPDLALTNWEAVRGLARLGGFLARNGDGDPGLKVLWRGLRTFALLRQGAQLASLFLDFCS